MKYEKYAGGYRVSGTLPNGVRLRKSLKGLNRAQAKDYVRRLTDEATVEVVTGKSPGPPRPLRKRQRLGLSLASI